MAKIIGKTEDGKDIYGQGFPVRVTCAKEASDGRRIVSMVGSSPRIDRDGDTIDQKGWVTKFFKRSPVVQWAHDHKIPNIAKVNKFSVTDVLKFEEIEFPKKGIHLFADMIYELMNGGFIKAGSVGFLPIKSERREMSDKEKENEPDYMCSPVKFEKQELLEFSICNVGSNRDALVTHLGEKGFKTSGKVKIEEHEFDVKQLIDAIFTEGEEETEEKHEPGKFDKEVKEELDITSGTDNEKSTKEIKNYCEISCDKKSGELSLKLLDAFKDLHGKKLRLSWKSESTERCFEANLQSHDEETDKWTDIETITIKDVEEKAGAVLSKTNKNKLKQAQSLIGEVLAASDPVETAPENGPDEKSQPPENAELKEILERISNMEKAIDAMAVVSPVVNVINNPEQKIDPIEGDDEFELDEVIQTKETEEGIEVDGLDTEEKDDEIDMDSLGDAISTMVREAVKGELRTVTGKID